MDYQIQQVVTVCPHVSQKLIEGDLRITGSVPETINRILDGIISDECDESHDGDNDQFVVRTSPVSTNLAAASKGNSGGGRTLLEHQQSDDDDDEILPDIALYSPLPSGSVLPILPSDNVRLIESDETVSGKEGILTNHYTDKNGICRPPRHTLETVNLRNNSRDIVGLEDSATTNEPKEELSRLVSPANYHATSTSILGKVGERNCSTDDYSVSCNEADSISASRTEVLDLTGEESSDSEVIAAKNPQIEISSSDDEAKSSNSCNTKFLETNNLNHAKIGVQDSKYINAITGPTKVVSKKHFQDGTKQPMLVIIPKLESVRNNMIDISSSDESEEDELPLWKRVQLNRGQSSSKSSNGFGRALSEIVPNGDNLNVVAKNGVDPLPSLQTSVGAQESQSSTISGFSMTGETVSSSVDLPLGKISSSVPSVTATSTDLSQVGDDATKGIKRKKRSPEEIQEMRQQALEKKLDRERKREEQNHSREQKKTEKQKEADHRKALREAHKALRPEECMKLMTVSVDQSLLEGKCGSAILQKLQELTCKVAVIKQPIDGAVTWCRQSTEHNLGQDIELGSLQKTIPETESLVVIEMSAFVPLVNASLQGRVGQPVDSERLNQHASHSMRTLDMEAVTYIVHGAQQYFRNSKNRHQRNFRSAVLGEDSDNNTKKKGKRKKGDDGLPNVSRVQMEEVLIDLQLQHGCNVHFRETPDSVAEFITMFAKAVAEKPFKKQRDKATFSFHVNSEWAGGAKVAKDGRGLIKVWKQQFQQFRNVSPEIAAAIVAQYPSPQLLLKGYERCSSTKEAELLLQDIVIRRGEGVLATSRRVGPELSRRVHKQMTSTDETLLL